MPPTNELVDLPRYNPARTYDWNYQHAPEPVEAEIAPVLGAWRFCGLPVDSPLGVPAGPLLNGRWVLYYASLGFDVLTYKTVRRTERACYAMPNLKPVAVADGLSEPTTSVPTAEAMSGSWAVSFGMPSQPPDVWRADVEQTRRRLAPGKVLSVSVVATVGDDDSLDVMADDYAQCARWAVEAGADAVETNFSCPNVSSCDGQLYQQPDAVAVVAARVREAIGRTPYLIKVGRVAEAEDAERLLEAVQGKADALAMTNSIAAQVRDGDGTLLFDGARRGICGAATRTASTEQVALFARIAAARGYDVEFVGVGGAATAADVQDYLAAGAHSVHLATAAMVDPTVAIQIRGELDMAAATSTSVK